MSRDTDKAVAAAGILALILGAIATLFVWLAGEKKKQIAKQEREHHEGKDIQDALDALQRLEYLRQSHMEAVQVLAQSQREELERLNGIPGRERLTEQYRGTIAQLESFIARQQNLLSQTCVVRMTQQMHGRLAVAIRARPDLMRLRSSIVQTNPTMAADIYAQAEQGFQEVVSRLRIVIQENDHLMSQDISSFAVSTEDTRQLVEVYEAVNTKAERLCEELGVRVDEMRFLRLSSRQCDLQAQAVRLDQAHAPGMTVVVEAADATLERLDELTDWVLQEMAKMEVEMTCAAAELDAASLAGVDLQAETQAAQEVSRHLAGLRQASRRTTS